MQLESAYTDGCLCIRYTGDLDHHAARAAFRETEAFIDRFLPRRCILDFSGVSFMDSSGIAVALHTLQQMKQLGGQMRITNSPMQVKKVFAAAGIQKMIGMEDVT